MIQGPTAEPGSRQPAPRYSRPLVSGLPGDRGTALWRPAYQHFTGPSRANVDLPLGLKRRVPSSSTPSMARWRTAAAFSRCSCYEAPAVMDKHAGGERGVRHTVVRRLRVLFRVLTRSTAAGNQWWYSVRHARLIRRQRLAGANDATFIGP